MPHIFTIPATLFQERGRSHHNINDKDQINLNDKSIKRLIDQTKFKNMNKKFNWKNIASGFFNFKRTHMTIKHISCVKNFW